jgi:hypothetical protein
MSQPAACSNHGGRLPLPVQSSSSQSTVRTTVNGLSPHNARRFNVHHSLDFRRYIKTAHGSTIPLTLNIRPREDGAWKIVALDGQRVRLEIAEGATEIFSQVDCQHRLGHLADIDLELPFMCFIGLDALP